MKKENSTKAKERTPLEKTVTAIEIVLSIAVIILASLQLLRIADNLTAIYVPLSGGVMLLQAVDNWKRSKAVSIFSFCAFIFIIAVSAVIIFCF